MSYKVRLALLVLLDSIIVSIAIFVAFWLVYPYTSTPYEQFIIILTAITLLLFHHLYSSIYSLYNKVWSYTNVSELLVIFEDNMFTIFSVYFFHIFLYVLFILTDVYIVY